MGQIHSVRQIQRVSATHKAFLTRRFSKSLSLLSLIHTFFKAMDLKEVFAFI